MTDQVEFRPTPGRDAMTRDGRRVTGLRPAGGQYVDGVLSGALPHGTVVTWWAHGAHSNYGPDSLDLVADWPDAEPDRRAGFEDRNGNTVRVGDAAVYFNGDLCVVTDVTQDGDATVCWAAGARTGVPGTHDTVKWNNLTGAPRYADPLPDADGWVKHSPGPCPVDAKTEVEVSYGLAWATEKGAARDFCWDKASYIRCVTHYRIVRPAPSGPVVEETVKRAYNDDQKRALGCLAHSIISGEPLESKYCRAILDMMAELEQRAKSARQIGEAMEGK